MHEGEVSALLGLTGIPSVSESTTIARDAAIARYEGGRIHVQHVSAAESADAVERAEDDHVRITADVTPHHLYPSADSVRSLEASDKLNQHLQSEDDRTALVQAQPSDT